MRSKNPELMEKISRYIGDYYRKAHRTPTVRAIADGVGLSKSAVYIRMILTDEVLPIEFYLHGERRFGGEIKKTDYDGLTMEFLAGHYGYSVEYLSQFEYEVHSWSGRYNVERQNHE